LIFMVDIPLGARTKGVMTKTMICVNAFPNAIQTTAGGGFVFPVRSR
jgi:hypothetical protein